MIFIKCVRRGEVFNKVRITHTKLQVGDQTSLHELLLTICLQKVVLLCVQFLVFFFFYLFFGLPYLIPSEGLSVKTLVSTFEKKVIS